MIWQKISIKIYLLVSVKKHFNILWNDIFTSTPKSYITRINFKTYKVIEMKKEKLIDLLRYIANIDCFILCRSLV